MTHCYIPSTSPQHPGHEHPPTSVACMSLWSKRMTVHTGKRGHLWVMPWRKTAQSSALTASESGRGGGGIPEEKVGEDGLCDCPSQPLGCSSLSPPLSFIATFIHRRAPASVGVTVHSSLLSLFPSPLSVGAFQVLSELPVRPRPSVLPSPCIPLVP